MSGADLETPSRQHTVTPSRVAALTPPDGFQGSQSHNRAIATGVVWQGGLRWLAQVLSWSATIVVARRLSAADYGIVGTTVFITGFLLLILDTSFQRTIVVTRQHDPKIVSQVHTASVLTGWGLAAVLCLLAYPVALLYREPRITPLLVFLALSIVLNGDTSVRVAVLQQRLNYRGVAQVEFTRSLTQAVVVLVSALGGLGYWSLSVGQVVGFLIACLVARHLVPLQLSRPDRVDLRPVLSYAGPLLASTLAWYIYSSGDFAILGRVSGLAALGYYQFAWNIAQLPGEKLANVLQAVVLPFFGAIGEDRRALKHYFLVLSELLVAVVLPVLVGFALVSPIAVPLIFGAKWLVSIPVMQVLVAVAAMSSVSLLSQHVLGATGQARVSARLHVTALCVLPPGFVLGAHLGGPMGVALVWLICQPMLVGYPLLKLREVIDLTVGAYLRNLMAPFTSSLVMALVVTAVRPLLHGVAPVLQIAVLAIVGALTYAGVFWFGFRPRVDRILAVWRHR